MRIFLIRHGQSQGNIDDRFYPAVGDPQIELTTQGWDQAIKAGIFLEKFLQDNKLRPPSKIWVSPFMRTKQTLRGLLHGFAAHSDITNTPIHEDLRIAEQSFGALPYKKHSRGLLKRTLSKLLIDFSRAVYKGSPFMTSPLMGESPMQLFKRVDNFRHMMMQDAADSQCEDILIVGHGAVIKSMLFSQFHLPMDAWKKLQKPGNTDIYMIDDEDGAWKVTRIYDGESGLAISENPIEGISNQIDISDLPALPPHL